MKRLLLPFLILASMLAANGRAETETIDLKALAKKARPAVMLLVVSDAAGKEIATGTGFLVSSDGKLITSHHVIEHAASAVAKAENGGLFPVEGVLADDPKNDLVLLKLKGKYLPFLTLGNSDKVEVGTRIAIIGSPIGLEGTLSEGIVSAVRDLISDIRILQITAAISPGSSGSPALNTKGEVIAVANSLLTGGHSLNFAVPVQHANRLLSKAGSSSEPQPLGMVAKAILSDADLWAVVAAQESENYVEFLMRANVLVARYAEKSDSQAAIAFIILGQAYYGLKFTDDAIAAYRQAIKLKPDSPLAWEDLGIICRESGKTDAAIVAFRQAIKLSPDSIKAWFNLGLACTSSGHNEDAFAAYRQVVKLKPDLPDAWLAVCMCFGQLARTDEEIAQGIAACRQAIKLKPDSADSNGARAILESLQRAGGSNLK
jgi:cytochrome c-type biogenesis protein CcmH/NrfG